MYNAFYGFEEAPFNLTPDPRFLFLSERHREAYDHLLFGIRERKGFIQITGEVGAGKTTLSRAVLAELGPAYKTALILNPSLTATQLLRAILVELGLEPPRRLDRAAALTMLNEFLLAQLAAGNDVVLLIDEAQDLSRELLEQVRLLSNLETDQRKLLQIALIGQPELRERLDRADLRQLRQRITVRYHLAPLSRPETEAYVAYRLQVAGGNGRPSFTRWALWAIHRYAGGVPRLINAVCDKTLLCGFVAGAQTLNLHHVRRAVRELEGQGMSLIRDALERARDEAERQRRGEAAPAAPRSFRRAAPGPLGGRWLALALGVVFGALVAGGAVWMMSPTSGNGGVSPVGPVVPTTPVPTTPVPTTAPEGSEADPATPVEAATDEIPRLRASLGPPSARDDGSEEGGPAPGTITSSPPTPRPTTAPAPAPEPPPAPPPQPTPVTPRPPRAPATPREFTGQATTPGGAVLDLGGIAYSASGPVALVNGKALGPGEGLVTTAGEAYLVESIEPERVTLVSAGTRVVIRLQ